LSSRTVRLSFTIPSATATTLKERVKAGKRSGFVAEAIKERLRSIQEEEFRREMIEGYIAEREEDIALNREWEAITLEGWPEYEEVNS
jgi:hypothetical protein